MLTATCMTRRAPATATQYIISALRVNMSLTTGQNCAMHHVGRGTASGHLIPPPTSPLETTSLGHRSRSEEDALDLDLMAGRILRLRLAERPGQGVVAVPDVRGAHCPAVVADDVGHVDR